jgi:hypothetical protein
MNESEKSKRLSKNFEVKNGRDVQKLGEWFRRIPG